VRIQELFVRENLELSFSLMNRHSKIIFISGIFNIIHPGHLRLLRFASELNGKLIVGVFSDRVATSSAHVPEDMRLDGVASNNWVDDAFIMYKPINEVIGDIRPDVIVKGKEHESKFNIEKELVEAYGGRLLFSSGESHFSSLDLLRKEFHVSNLRSINLPSSYLDRHNINYKDLIELIYKFSSIKVCVVGDLIIDEYITCEPLGLSQEDPTIVVTPIDKIRFIGGAGIVAAHAAGLGSDVKFISLTGDDDLYDFSKYELSKSGVDSILIKDENRPTTLKQRFRSKGKSLLRVSHLHQEAANSSLQDMMFHEVESIIEDVDLIVFSDFNYGCLPQELVNRISEIAHLNNVILTADSQSSSQIGNIGRFKGMHLITPTEREARISERNNEDGLVVLAEKLRKQSAAQNVFLKLAEEGVLIHANKFVKKNIPKEDGWITDRVPAMNTTPKDVAGAGDSLIITASLALASGGNIFESAFLGSLAAAIQVGRVGNMPLQLNELISEIR
jgi:rfaE bifunctional protein kinase chain/domain